MSLACTYGLWISCVPPANFKDVIYFGGRFPVSPAHRCTFGATRRFVLATQRDVRLPASVISIVRSWAAICSPQVHVGSSGVSTRGPTGPVQSRPTSGCLKPFTAAPGPDLVRFADNRPKVEECLPWPRASGRSSRTTVVVHVCTDSVLVCAPVRAARSSLHVAARAVHA